MPDLAVECLLPGTDRPEASIALPLDALADFEGRDDTPVVLEAAAPGRTVVRWEDRGIPQTREYAVPELAGLPPFPEPPADFEACPGRPARRPGRGRRDDRRGLDPLRPGLPPAQGRHRRGGRHRRPADPHPGRLPLPLGGRPAGPPHAALRQPRAAARPAGRGRQDRRPRRAPGRGLDDLAGDPGRRPLPAHRAGDPRRAGGGHPAPARPRGRARSWAGRWTGSPAARPTTRR